MIKQVYYVIGITCAGKDFFIESALRKYPDVFGACQVGKEFRKRYPPEYFQGQGAPEHTEREAMEIFKGQMTAADDAGKKIVLVSGQPRRPSQVELCLNYKWGEVIWVHASDEIILLRIRDRFRDDPAGYNLAIQRVINDKIMYYDVLYELNKRSMKILTFDTQNHSIDNLIFLLKDKHETPK